MKILDWMHRKLHPVSSNYTRLPSRKASAFEEAAGKITEAVHNSDQSAAEINNYTETSLLHHDELERILSIGTLGHPHPCFLSNHFPEQQEEDDELNLDSPKTEAPMAAEKPPAKITLLQSPVEKFMVETEPSGKMVVADLAEEKIMTEVPLLKEDREKKAERTTLADLLLEESACTGVEPAIAGAIKNAIAVQSIFCASLSASALKSGNKEKMKQIKKKNKEDHAESSTAAKRIRRMITRMVKKKIHPVAEAGAEMPERNDGGAPAVGVINPHLLSHGGSSKCNDG